MRAFSWVADFLVCLYMEEWGELALWGLSWLIGVFLTAHRLSLIAEEAIELKGSVAAAYRFSSPTED